MRTKGTYQVPTQRAVLGSSLFRVDILIQRLLKNVRPQLVASLVLVQSVSGKQFAARFAIGQVMLLSWHEVDVLLTVRDFLKGKIRGLNFGPMIKA